MSYSPMLGSDRRAGEASSGLPSSTSIRDTLSGAISSTKAYLQPFAPGSPYLGTNGANAQNETGRLLSDVAPQLMTTRMMAAVTNSNTALGLTPDGQRRARLLLTPGFSITSPARSLVRIGGSLIQSGIGRGPMNGITSHELFVLEESDRILATAAQDLDLEPNQSAPTAAIEGAKSRSEASVSLLRGFQATIPSSTEGRQRRRRVRAIASGFEDGPQGPTKLGLKAMGDKARGLMVEGVNTEPVSAFQAREQRHARRNQASRILSRGKDGARASVIELEELERQLREIEREQDDVGVRRSLIDFEVAAVDAKIKVLEKIKAGLNKKLLGLREEELELNDEHEGVGELLAVQKHLRAMPGGPAAAANAAASGATTSQSNSRRRKGPLFMPSEHDELPSGVAFMTLADHSAPITSLDFTEPYGTLVSASLDETVRVWDLASGDEVGRLRGHTGTVKCLQVEDEVCITGGTDNTIRIWDLTKVENFEARLTMTASGELPARRKSPDLNRNTNFARDKSMRSTKIRDGNTTTGDEEDGEEEEVRDEFDPCVKSLEGHSKSVTALYFDDNCLVTGASDKTLRQWDLNTGQCVLTMDILWAISNPTSSQAISQSEFGFPDSPSRKAPSSAILGPTRPDLNTRDSFSVLNNLSGAFAYPTPPYADGSWEMYQDFVGGVQFWGYALASGSGDGGVRMWDMRTGQAHRTLLGHTAPVTCLQFDEHHVISGSLDKSIRIWDLRMGSISDTIRYDHPVTALQFDSRKILGATGENGAKMFNRTTLQHGSLTLNGHTSPVERLRYMDRYAVSGGKDSVVKIWAL